ncbi:hypothetical protein B0T25DRAFT_64056 [Lasiosphaeria hispida]|uniref:Uncharacterized protein n=1 Tax=Lasiosphaeria hispida TaxID=260671 RepID=A0AAJ0HXD4_9PEZI|nr:hypothetical protein B0T25DRAFT_64056 [Lasiosphaeria hispida]
MDGFLVTADRRERPCIFPSLPSPSPPRWPGDVVNCTATAPLTVSVPVAAFDLPPQLWGSGGGFLFVWTGEKGLGRGVEGRKRERGGVQCGAFVFAIVYMCFFFFFFCAWPCYQRSIHSYLSVCIWGRLADDAGTAKQASIHAVEQSGGKRVVFLLLFPLVLTAVPVRKGMDGRYRGWGFGGDRFPWPPWGDHMVRWFGRG